MFNHFSQKTLFLVLALTGQAHALNLHVVPNGKDTNPGTEGAPLATLAAARDAARKVTGKEAVTVHVGDGIYYLRETLVFTPADSGSAEFPVVYRAVNEGRAVLSGGSELKLDWKPFRNGIFQAPTPQGLKIDQLFINSKAQRMARYPNFDAAKKTAAYQGYSADAFSKERAVKWADPVGGYIHAMHTSRWGGYHYLITGKDAEGNVTYEGGWQNNRQMGMHKDFRMVENIFEELEAPGEWFYDDKTSTLYFLPEAGIKLATAKVEVVRLRHLVELAGTQEKPVKYISLQGFTVRHAARTFMDCKEPLLRSDWAIYRGGAFLLTGTEDIDIRDCEFDQVGGNAIFVNHYNRRVLIKGCHIHDAGASGVCFVGDPSAVRNPLFEYSQSQDLTKVDPTTGPKSKNYPADSTVEDCLIHGIGRVERQPAAVQISMSKGITVRDTSIYDCARSGINISEGTWGGHLIDGCDVFDTVLETHDHGSFNSWGRDRFWDKSRPKTEAAVALNPDLPFLDAGTPTIIRNSRWRCDHGWDVDLDDGSTHYEIYNNVFLKGGLKLREGYRRIVTNNIAYNSAACPHVWYKGSQDSLKNNIWMTAYRPAGMPKDKWGGVSDSNLFGSESALQAAQAMGWDANSLVGDPRFIDPAKGDFRVREDSPALKLGFKNFPMDRFGVKNPSLKAIARTPEIPPVQTESNRQRGPATGEWLGARLQELDGEAFSAYGIAKDEGGVAIIEVPKGSAAARAGLKTGDLVQQVNGQRASRIRPMLRLTAQKGAGPLTLKIVRDQTPMTLTLVVAGDGAQSPDASRAALKQANAATVENISIAGKPVTIKVPDQPAPGNPWLWVGEFPGVLKSLEDGLVKKGWHVVHVRVSNQFGSPRAMEVWEKVYEEMHGKRGLSAKPALLGISRGGLFVTAWTRLHPDRVSALYLDNGVCDIRSWPAGFPLTKQGQGSTKDWALCKTELGYTNDADAGEKATKPCDGMLPAIQAGVLLISCHGTADMVVPYEDNAAHLVKLWQDNRGSLKLFPKEGGDHHPHGLRDPAPLIAAIAGEGA